MAIQGSLEEAPLPDVLQLLSLGKKTGSLALTEREMQGEICLENGLVCHAAVFTRRDRLGDMLVRTGRITQQQLNEAIRLEQEGGQQVSQTLLASGQVERAEVEKFIRAQVEEAVYFMFTWRTGSFAFTSSVQPKRQELLVAIDPEGLLLEGARRVDEWSEIEKKIPSLDLIFRLEHARIDGAHALTPEQQQILPLVDGTRDVNAIIETTGLAEFDVGKALYGLITAGYARMVDRRATMRHLDYRELLAYVVREAEFAEPERRRAAARHIADCATCTQRLKTIHVRRTGAISSFTPRPEVASSEAPVAEVPSTDRSSGAALAPGGGERRMAERRTGADRRDDDRRRGEDRRQVRSPEWELPGRDRRSGADRRVDMRRISERRIGGLGDRQSAAVLAARPLTLPQRSRSGERRVTGPRRLPRRDSGGPGASRRDTGGRIRLQPAEAPTAPPPEPTPKADKPPARPEQAEDAAPRAAQADAATQGEAAAEATVELSAAKRTKPPAKPAPRAAPARPAPAQRRKEPEVPELPEAVTAAPEAADEETIDIGLGLEPTAPPAPQPEVKDSPDIGLGLESTAPPVPAAKELPGLERTAPPDAPSAEITAPGLGLEATAPPSPTPAAAKDSPTPAAGEVAPDRGRGQPEVSPEPPRSTPQRPPARSRDIQWLVSPAEANHLLRTSRVGLAAPTEEREAFKPPKADAPPRTMDAPKPAAAAKPAVPPTREPSKPPEVITAAEPSQGHPKPPETVAEAPKARQQPTSRRRGHAPTAPPPEPAPPARPSPTMTAPAPVREVERPREPDLIEPPVRDLGGAAPASGVTVRLEREPEPGRPSMGRWIGIAAAAVVLIGVGLLAKPLLREGGTESPRAVPAMTSADPVSRPPVDEAPRSSPAPEQEQLTAQPAEEPPVSVREPLAAAAPPTRQDRAAQPPPAQEARVTAPPPAEETRAAQPSPVRETLPAAQPAPAVATVRGIVRDARSGAAMAGVQVSIPGTSFRATTDASGAYTFRDVPAGRVSISAAAEGRTAGTREVVLQPGGSVEVAFALEEPAPERTPQPAPAAATPPTPAPVATAPTPREADAELESGGWKVVDATTASAVLKTPLATIRGLWIESVATIETVSRPRARIALLTSSGDRIVLTETRSGAPIMGSPRVTAVRIVPPSDAYPVTTGTASFGSLLVTAKATLPPAELEALLMTLVVIE